MLIVYNTKFGQKQPFIGRSQPAACGAQQPVSSPLANGGCGYLFESDFQDFDLSKLPEL